MSRHHNDENASKLGLDILIDVPDTGLFFLEKHVWFLESLADRVSGRTSNLIAGRVQSGRRVMLVLWFTHQFSDTGCQLFLKY